MISFLFGTNNKGNGIRGARTRSATTTSNTIPQDVSNTSTEGSGEVEEDENSSSNEDKNLEERQDENKDSSNRANF
eukprot:5288404-Ditylum_brightwellii.AAC.1